MPSWIDSESPVVCVNPEVPARPAPSSMELYHLRKRVACAVYQFQIAVNITLFPIVH